MKYELKWPNGRAYEYTLEEIKGGVAKGTITEQFAVRSRGEKNWRSIPDFLGVPFASTQCFVIFGEERQGPYLQDQLRSMWQSGSITADALITWEGCKEALPAKDLFSEPSSASIPPTGVSQADVSRRVGLTIFGGAIGLLTSYLMRPTVFGRGPSFEEWFTEGFNSPYASTIYTCAVIGLFVGFIIAHFLDSSAKSK